MFNYMSNRFALSNKGTLDFSKGILFTVFLNIALLLPAIYIFLFFDDYLNSYLVSNKNVEGGFIYYIIIGIAFMGLMWIISIYQYKNTYTSVYNESADRRINLAEKLRKLPLAFFGQKNLSDLTSTIMSDATDLEHTFSHAVPQLFASIISITLVAVGLFVYNWQLALSLFWILPVAALLILLSKKSISKSNYKMYNVKRDVTESIQECIETIQEIKSYSNEEAYLNKLQTELNIYEKNMIKSELSAGVIVNSAQSLLKIGMASVIIVGAGLIIDGSIELFTYLVFLLVSATIYNPINEVFNNLAALFYLDIRINRMREMDSLPIQGGETEFNPNNYDIEFKDVSFSYEKDKQVLDNVSFKAKQGEITALVGPSGGGKSTAAKLAARFWDIDSGKILLGGQDISEIDPEELLKNYSIVFQDVQLFNSTISDNIRMGKMDATEEDIINAATLAQCDDFISRMPDGYNTIIGENGETLSGGERQRISIARALLKDAPIVLLDEATASLDVENETKIQAGISELIKNKTVLIIAHRMRTVSNADKIIVLKEGTVAEQGNPKELKETEGLFADMVNLQMQAASK